MRRQSRPPIGLFLLLVAAFALCCALMALAVGAQPEHASLHHARVAAMPGTVAVLTRPDGRAVQYPGPGQFHQTTGGVPIHDGSIVWVRADGLAGWRLPDDDYRVVFLLPAQNRARPERVQIPWDHLSDAERRRRLEAGEDSQ